MKKISWLLLLAAMACNPSEKKETDADTPVKDPHSYANTEAVVAKHLDLDITVDFTSQQLSGKASWEIDQLAKTDHIIFDTWKLQVSKITLDNDDTTSFELGKEAPSFGQPLRVSIRPGTKKVNIYYTTSKEASALQWLTPQQTAGKKQPFLFTQSQPILARSWVPCQDGPAVRFTYTATLKVPPALMAVMSAENAQSRSADGVYHFKQPHPIPSYLMALAVGDIAFKAVDSRTGVYAEPSVLEKAAWEFADMGKMVDAAEKIYGPYRWGRYDLLVLPPSFPYGGMENPMLTFATPTVIAGDRSLVSLVAHELAHSWSGNLVTNATWNDMWLNEGFTVYFERRIIEALYGKSEFNMQEVIGRQDLLATVADKGDTSRDTRLKLDLAGRDPDEGISDIAYEKGYAFLRTIEENVGRTAFDAFLKNYFTTHAFHSRTTEQFLEELQQAFSDQKDFATQVRIKDWVYSAGIPGNIPPAVSPEFNTIDTILLNRTFISQAAGLSNRLTATNQRLYFLRRLPEDITAAEMALLDNEFHFSQSGNAEIQTAWYTWAIRKQYRAANPYIETFLNNVGRRKFLRPLYGEMIKTPEGKAWAKKIYATARGNYHPVAYTTIDAMLK